MKFTVYDIVPVPKPRQTHSAKWKKTSSDERYYRFKDDIRLLNTSVPEKGVHVIFVLNMPKSWTKKKKVEMLHQPHQQKPDVDNLIKALFDGVYEDDDSHIWDCRMTKVWGRVGKMVIISEIETEWVSEFVSGIDF